MVSQTNQPELSLDLRKLRRPHLLVATIRALENIRVVQKDYDIDLQIQCRPEPVLATAEA